MRQPAGFSLFEVLISMGLLATIMYVVTNLSSRAFEIKSSLSQRNLVTQRLNVGMEQLTNDLSQAFLLDSRVDKRSAGGGRTIFMIENQKNSHRLRMTYMGHRSNKRDGRESDFAYVVYEVKPRPKQPQRSDLYRGEMLRVPGPQYAFKDDPKMHVFVRDVAELKLEPWSGENWLKDGWNSLQGETMFRLPQLVKITLQVWEDELPADASSDEVEQLQAKAQYTTIVRLAYALDFNEIKSRNKSFRLF